MVNGSTLWLMYQGFMHLDTETRAAELHWSFLFLVNLAPLQAPPKAGAKELLYSLNLIHEFTSLFSPKVYNFCRFAQEGLPRNQVFVDISVFLWLRKQRPRFAQGRPKGYFQAKELHRTAQAIARMNADWKVEKGHYAEVNVPTCGKIAAWLLCKETQPLWNSHDSWWPELNMFGSMPWCSFPWHKLLARLAQTNCHTTVWIWSISLR